MYLTFQLKQICQITIGFYFNAITNSASLVREVAHKSLESNAQKLGTNRGRDKNFSLNYNTGTATKIEFCLIHYHITVKIKSMFILFPLGNSEHY